MLRGCEGHRGKRGESRVSASIAPEATQALGCSLSASILCLSLTCGSLVSQTTQVMLLLDAALVVSSHPAQKANYSVVWSKQYVKLGAAIHVAYTSCLNVCAPVYPQLYLALSNNKYVVQVKALVRLLCKDKLALPIPSSS